MAGSNENFWSSTHIRLRLEVFLTSLAIFGVNYLELSLGDSGLLPVQFGANLAKVWANLALYSLFAYFVGALLLRTLSEQYRRRDVASTIETALRTLRDLADNPTPEPVNHTLNVPDYRLPPERTVLSAEDMQSDIAFANLEKAIGGLPQGNVSNFGAEALKELRKVVLAWQREHRELRSNADLAKRFDARISAIEIQLADAKSEILASYDNARSAFSDDTRRMKEMGQQLLQKVTLWRDVADWEHLAFGLWIPLAVSLLMALSPLVKLAFPDVSFSLPTSPTQGPINYFVG